MSDAKNRELERRAAQGDASAEVKLLLQRVRARELTEEQLRLAAYLGHEASWAALGRPAKLGSARSQAAYTAHWVSGAQVEHASPIAFRWRCAFAAVEATTEGWTAWLAEQGRTGRDWDNYRDAEKAIAAGWVEGIPFDSGAFAMIRDSVKFSSRAHVEAAIQSELVPWVLGTGDPVLDRLAAREAAESEGSGASA